jgi:hypothetical protein
VLSKQEKLIARTVCCLLIAGFFGLRYQPEDGGDVFLWNIHRFLFP